MGHRWDVKRRVPLSVGTHNHLANQCAFNAEGRLLASAGSGNTARLWSVPVMRLLTISNDH
jgi:hypothetical protein